MLVIYVFISLYIAKISIIFVSSTVDEHLDFQLVTIMNYTSRIDRNLFPSGAIPRVEWLVLGIGMFSFSGFC